MTIAQLPHAMMGVVRKRVVVSRRSGGGVYVVVRGKESLYIHIFPTGDGRTEKE